MAQTMATRRLLRLSEHPGLSFEQRASVLRVIGELAITGKTGGSRMTEEQSLKRHGD